MLISDLIPLIKPTLKQKEISLFSNILTVYGYSSHDSNVLEFYKNIGENFEWFADKSKIPATWRVSSARTNYQILTKVLTVCEELRNKLGSQLVEQVKTNINKYRSLLAKQKDEQPKQVQTQKTQPQKSSPKHVQVIKQDDASEDAFDDDTDVEEALEAEETSPEMIHMLKNKIYNLQEENSSLQKKLQIQTEITMSQLDTQAKLMDIIKEQEELLRKVID